jgi:FHA domain
MVTGVYCSRQHLNDPRARFCAECGVSMNQASFIAMKGKRPSLGVLVFTDGTTVPLTHDLIVGRLPGQSTRVQRGEATALTLPDRKGHLSRMHAEIRLVEWDVHLYDLSSANGTSFYDQSARRWRRLSPRRPYVLVPGMGIAFGRVTAIFQSPLRAT